MKNQFSGWFPFPTLDLFPRLIKELTRRTEVVLECLMIKAAPPRSSTKKKISKNLLLLIVTVRVDWSVHNVKGERNVVVIRAVKTSCVAAKHMDLVRNVECGMSAVIAERIPRMAFNVLIAQNGFIGGA